MGYSSEGVFEMEKRAYRQRRNTDLLDIAKACLIAHDTRLAGRVFQALENPTTFD